MLIQTFSTQKWCWHNDIIAIYKTENLYEISRIPQKPGNNIHPNTKLRSNYKEGRWVEKSMGCSRMDLSSNLLPPFKKLQSEALSTEAKSRAIQQHTGWSTLLWYVHECVHIMHLTCSYITHTHTIEDRCIERDKNNSSYLSPSWKQSISAQREIASA